MQSDMTIDLAIAELRDETDRIRIFDLQGTGELPGYSTGAHLKFETPAGSRSYSLIDYDVPANVPEMYRIAVQREDEGDGGSRFMHGLGIGDRLSAEAPKNDFPLTDHLAPALLLAGGIGITPLIGHAAALKAAGCPYSLHYSARSLAVMGFCERMQQAHGDAAHLWFDDARPLDLSALLGGLDPATHLYVCGPKGMIEAAREAALLPANQIHFELFTTDAAQDGDDSFEVEINDGRVFTIPAGRTIIEVLENEGIDLIYDCQRGDCGICQTDVLEGTPDHRDVVLSQSERDAGDVMQICVSRAKTGRLKLDI